MHLHTKFGIPISKNIGYAPDSRNKVRGQVQGQSDLIMVNDTCHPKMHPHTKFEIPTSNNTRDMLWT